MKNFIKKYYLILLGLILLILLGLSYYVYQRNQFPKDFYVDLDIPNINVYDEVNFQDLIEDSNATFANLKLDTSKTGELNAKVKFTYKNRDYDYSFNYMVTDTVAPKIFGSGSKSVNVNYDKELCDLITYADNYDRYLDCQIEGDYDLAKVGNYKIKYIITDDFENEATHNLTLNVVEPKSNNDSSTSPKTNLLFAEAQEKYQTAELEMGIDVSKWQGDIDFNQVKEAGVTFVMMRIGIRSEIGKEINIDSYFLENIKKAQEANLKIGVYLYSKAMNEKEAQEEAKWIIKTLDGAKLDLPICFDWENWSNWNSYHLNFYDLNNMAKTFIKTVEEAGYQGMLYSSKFYLENFWFDQDFANIWLAHYTNKTSYSDYDMWQFSNIGKIAGINGDVDFDVLKKNVNFN